MAQRTKTTTRKATKAVRKTKKAPAKSKPRAAGTAKKTTSTARKKPAAPAATKKESKPRAKAAKRSAPKAKRKAVAKVAVAKKEVKRPKARSKAPVVAVDPRPAPRMTVQWGSQRIELAEEGRPVPKTKLIRKELREFKEMLLVKRCELVGDVENLTNQALSGNQASGGLSSMPVHMADIGSDNWEQEFALGLIENERSLVREIDEALDRIANRTYGVCIATHREIVKSRLRAKPWAKFCIEYAHLRELGRVP